LGAMYAWNYRHTRARRIPRALTDIIDFDASLVLYGVESLKACGTRLFEEIIKVANGKHVQAEKTGHTAFAIGKILPE
jgi:altronate dehydratase large subunit